MNSPNPTDIFKALVALIDSPAAILGWIIPPIASQIVGYGDDVLKYVTAISYLILLCFGLYVRYKKLQQEIADSEQNRALRDKEMKMKEEKHDHEINNEDDK